MPLDVTNRFVLDFARRYGSGHPGARILDYGCGAGRLVEAGLAAGLDISGAEVYYGGSRTRADAQASGLLGTAIHEMREGRTSFAPASFDLIVSNQVMEHVENLDAVLEELNRILKTGGTMLHIFPSRDVLREGHIGIPFSHWFPRNSKLRFYYTWLLRRMGLGTWKNEAATCRQWAADKLRWIDTYTHYRRRGEILACFGRRFRNELREADYIRYRLLDRGGRAWLAALLDLPLAPWLACAVFRKLAFLVIVSRKAAA